MLIGAEKAYSSAMNTPAFTVEGKLEAFSVTRFSAEPISRLTTSCRVPEVEEIAGRTQLRLARPAIIAKAIDSRTKLA
jgi:hypothetical protein